PEVGGINPVIMRMDVDFPAPLGPRKPRTSPRSTPNETLFTASFGPNALVRFWTLIIPFFWLCRPAQNEDSRCAFCKQTQYWAISISKTPDLSRGSLTLTKPRGNRQAPIVDGAWPNLRGSVTL